MRYFENDKDAEGLSGIGRTAVIVPAKSGQTHGETPHDEDTMDIDDEPAVGGEDAVGDEEQAASLLVTGGTIFHSELEVSSERNGSRLFQKLAHESRKLCKSLVELLHHRMRLVDLLYAYLLSPRGGDGTSPTPCRLPNEAWGVYTKRLAGDVPDHGRRPAPPWGTGAGAAGGYIPT